MWAKTVATGLIWTLGLGGAITAIALTSSTSYLGGNWLTSLAGIFFGCVLLMALYRTTVFIWNYSPDAQRIRPEDYVRRAPSISSKTKNEAYARARQLAERLTPEELEDLATAYGIEDRDNISLDDLIKEEAKRQRYQ